MIDPSVSVPIANPTRPPAVAEADPADDPLEPTLMSHGLLVVPANHTSHCANAPIESLAKSTAPAWKSRSIQVALYAGTWSLKGSAPQVVRMPLVLNRSFAPKGIPWRGPRYF